MEKNTTPLAIPGYREVMPQRLVEEIYAVTNGKAIMASDVGSTRCAAQYYKFEEPRSHLSQAVLAPWGLVFRQP